MDNQPVNIQTPPVVDYRPPAVRAAAERADALQKAFIADMNGEVPAEVIVTPPPSVQVQIPVVTPPPADQPVTVPAPAPEIQRPAAMGPIDDDSIPPAGTTPEVWEQRFRSYKGRAERTISDTRQMVEQLTQRIGELENQIQNAPKNIPVVTQTGNIDLTQLGLTQEEIDMVGPELLTTFEKVARGAAAAAASQTAEQLRPDVEEAKRLANQQREDAMVRNLDSYLSPKFGVNFEEINKNRNFLAFLKLTPAGSRVTFHKFLLDAWAKFDTPRVLEIVNAFLEGTPAPAQVVPQNPAPVNPAAPRVPQIPLASLAAPGSGHAPSAPPPSAEAKQTYTRAQVQEFYRQCAKGYLANDPAQKAAYEAEIALAAAEGRIH